MVTAATAQVAVLRGLWALVVNDDENKEMLCREHGIPAIVGAMQAHPQSSDLQSASCMVVL